MFALQKNLCLRAPARFAGRRMAVQVSAADKAAMIKSTVEANKVVVFSKTYCPYCSRAKSLFKQLNVDAKVLELDQMNDGADIQASLQSLTGSRTVPQVFIGNQFIGGCDDTYAAYNSGKLATILQEAGIKVAA